MQASKAQQQGQEQRERRRHLYELGNPQGEQQPQGLGGEPPVRRALQEPDEAGAQADDQKQREYAEEHEDQFPRHVARGDVSPR